MTAPGNCGNVLLAPDPSAFGREAQTMEKRCMSAQGAPPAQGPYSHAVSCGELLFVSGQIPIDPKTGELVQGDIETQAEAALRNLRTVLEDCGSGIDKVLKTTVFLADMDEFARFNAVYERFFSQDFPARSCVQAGRLPLDVKVEIEAIATL